MFSTSLILTKLGDCTSLWRGHLKHFGSMFKNVEFLVITVCIVCVNFGIFVCPAFIGCLRRKLICRLQDPFHWQQGLLHHFCNRTRTKKSKKLNKVTLVANKPDHRDQNSELQIFWSCNHEYHSRNMRQHQHVVTIFAGEQKQEIRS